MRRTLTGKQSDLLFDSANLTLLTLLFLIILYPLLYIVSASISDPVLVNTGQVILLPKGVTLSGYQRIFQDPSIIQGFLNTLFYTTFGTTINIVLTLSGAFALSKKTLPGRFFFMILITLTMYFSGGMIPTYILIKNLGMLNSFWAVTIPGAVSAYNLILCRTFFANSLPPDIEESALIDGAGRIRTFIQIVLPLSQALISVMILFYAVGHWNAYFSAMIYLTKRPLFSLQQILREILIDSQLKMAMIAGGSGEVDELVAEQVKLASLIKYGVIVVSSLPVIVVYPFIQQYFTQGILLGSVKG